MIAVMLRVVCLAGVTILGACGGTPDVPGVSNLALQGSKDLNPSRGTSNPVQVRVYQLRNTEKFNNADYFQLTEREGVTLGDALVMRDEYFLHPGESITVPLTIKPGARFLGIAAAYREIERATWRAAAPIVARMPVLLAADTVKIVAQ